MLVTRLVDQETVNQYYPPTYSSVPSAYYGGWYGYYNMGYTYMSSPGYSETNHVYRLETNLYDRAGDKLLWSGSCHADHHDRGRPSLERDPSLDRRPRR